MKILFIGDVFGRPGRRALGAWLPNYRDENDVDFVIAKHKLCPSPTGARDYCGPLAYKAVADRLFHNLGDGNLIRPLANA